MRSAPSCIPCVIRQCQRAGRAAGYEDWISLTRASLMALTQGSLDDPPSRFTSHVLRAVYGLVGDDPYKRIKVEQSRLGRRVGAELKLWLKHSPDPLYQALIYAAASNVIDVGALDEVRIEEIFDTPRFHLDDYEEFRRGLASARSILYILDNAGEVHLDRLVLELLTGYELWVAVKSGPILNDATRVEAEEAGLGDLARIVETGSARLGVELDWASKEFLTAYEHSDLVIAKGHANFESLIDGPRSCYFLLKAKCPVVAQRLGVPLGALVFSHYPGAGR